MEKAPSELIDQYLNNYNKAKKWTFIWVTILCVLACILVFFIVRNKELMEENALLKAQQAIQKADSATVAAQASLLNTTRTVEILKQQDSLKNYEIQKLNLYNKKIVSLQENQPVKNIDDSIKKIQVKMQKVRQNSIATSPKNPGSSVSITTNTNLNSPKSIIVYVQYMPEFNDQKEKVVAILKGYGLQLPEKIERISFNSTVKYFNESDKSSATEIASLVSKAVGYNVEAKKINLKAPEKQIEVWLGKYKADDLKSLKRKVNQYYQY